MSSNTVCSSDGKWCTQAYPVKDYFLALFVIVVCLVSLRMLLYASYYSWLRISTRRQQQAHEGRPPDLVTPYAALGGTRMMPAASSGEDQRVCVIVAGEDRPTFIAQPSPLAPLRNPDEASDVKVVEMTKI